MALAKPLFEKWEEEEARRRNNCLMQFAIITLLVIAMIAVTGGVNERGERLKAEKAIMLLAK